LKFSKCISVAAAAGVLCVSMAFSAPAPAKNSEQNVTIQTSQSQSVDEATLPIDASASSSANQSRKSSTVWILIRMILVLAFVLACIYAVVYFMKKGLAPGSDNDPFLRKVTSISLAPGKSVQVVTLLDNAYIIGVTDNAVNLIGQVNDKELVDAMNLYADKNAKNTKPRNFNDVLALFMPNSAEKKNVFSDSAQSAADLLKKQRDRLNNGDKK